MEFHGSEAAVREQAELVGAVCAENGGGDFQWADKAEDRSRLWEARHEAAYAAAAQRPGSRMWATDVCVPISRLADCVVETRRDIDDSGLYAPILGHVGDGNFHLVLMVDPDDADELERAKALNDRLVARALSMDGTCTGEHGVGLGKIHCLEQEHGEALSVMRAVKAALDPDNIMNPGKIVRL
jgi:D-lactate dehydrogenase (cytochrome)